MKKCVSTLPITPRKSFSLGSHLSTFVSRIIAEHANQAFLVPINTIGSSSRNSVYLRNYIDTIASLIGGNPTPWVDADRKWDGILSHALKLLSHQGSIRTEIREVLTCQCGKSERLNMEGGIRGRRRVAEHLTDKTETCNLCQSQLEPINRKCLLLKLSGAADATVSSPKYAKLDTAQLAKTWHGREILIDRQRETGVQCSFHGISYSIDPDFCLMCIPWVCAQEGLEITTLVSSTLTHRQAILAVMVSAALGFHVAKLHVTPIMRMHDSNQATDHGTHRLLLSMAAGSEGKEVSIDSSDIKLAKRFISQIGNPERVFNKVGYSIKHLKKPSVTRAIAQILKAQRAEHSHRLVLHTSP